MSARSARTTCLPIALLPVLGPSRFNELTRAFHSRRSVGSVSFDSRRQSHANGDRARPRSRSWETAKRSIFHISHNCIERGASTSTSEDWLTNGSQDQLRGNEHPRGLKRKQVACLCQLWASPNLTVRRGDAGDQPRRKLCFERLGCTVRLGERQLYPLPSLHHVVSRAFVWHASTRRTDRYRPCADLPVSNLHSILTD